MNGTMIEVELCCPTCGGVSRYRVYRSPETLHYVCRNLDCEASGRSDPSKVRVFSWDSAYCKVVGFPEAVAAIAQGKRYEAVSENECTSDAIMDVQGESAQKLIEVGGRMAKTLAGLKRLSVAIQDLEEMARNEPQSLDSVDVAKVLSDFRKTLVEPLIEFAETGSPAALVEDGDVGTLAAERACGLRERVS